MVSYKKMCTAEVLCVFLFCFFFRFRIMSVLALFKFLCEVSVRASATDTAVRSLFYEFRSSLLASSKI